MRNAYAEGLSDTLEDGMEIHDEDGHDLQAPDEVLQLAREIMSDSESYLDVSHRRQIEKNLANHQSRHPAGSKYFAKSYAHRSKLFVPKTRAVGQRTEAAVSAAFFSTNKVTEISPANTSNPKHVAGADLYHQILEYRFKNTMPWYLTVIGAAQDAFVQGVCASHQYWDYKEDSDGDVVRDTPRVDNIPLEYLRWSPAADWRMPIEDSEYIHHIIPMTVAQVRAKMESVNGAKPEWMEATNAQIRAASPDDLTRKSREWNQGEALEADTIDLHQIAIVNKIIVRREGIDYCFYVLGEHKLLTDPIKLKDVTPNGMRNYVVGLMTVETHKSIPQAQVQLMEALQADVNEITNTRKDNVNLALNKRFLVRRRGKVDLPALLRNVPGGSVMVNEHDDVKEMVVSDVTGSSYKEQEFSNAGFDEIAGSFSPASVNTNRRMGETAAGMELLAADSNIMTEYHIELFAETWLQPVLRQLLALEQAYEDDFSVFSRAAHEAGLQDQGITEIDEEILTADLKLVVSVGVDATNPARKMQRFTNGITLGAQLGAPIDPTKVFNESMGILGFPDGSLFLQDQEAEPQPDPEAMKVQAEMELQNNRLQLDVQKAQFQVDQFMQKMERDGQKSQADQQLRRELGEEKSETEIGIALIKDRTARQIAQLQADTASQQELVSQ
jgi:hypothetical protein